MATSLLVNHAHTRDSPSVVNWATLWHVTLRCYSSHFLCNSQLRHFKKTSKSQESSTRHVKTLGGNKQGSRLQCGLLSRSKLKTLKRMSQGKRSLSASFHFCSSTLTFQTPSYLWHKPAPVHTTLHSCRTGGWRHCAHWASHNPAHMCTAAHRPSQTHCVPAYVHLERMEGHHTVHLSTTNTDACNVKKRGKDTSSLQSWT